MTFLQNNYEILHVIALFCLFLFSFGTMGKAVNVRASVYFTLGLFSKLLSALLWFMYLLVHGVSVVYTSPCEVSRVCWYLFLYTTISLLYPAKVSLSDKIVFSPIIMLLLTNAVSQSVFHGGWIINICIFLVTTPVIFTCFISVIQKDCSGRYRFFFICVILQCLLELLLMWCSGNVYTVVNILETLFSFFIVFSFYFANHEWEWNPDFFRRFM